MTTDLIFSFILLFFVYYGITRPHVALCLAVWVNMVKPQSTSYSFLSGMPLSLISTIFFFLVFIVHIKKCKIPKNAWYHILMIGFMIWFTISNIRAEFPVLSSFKYDVAIKTVLFAYFIPFALTTKKQIEFFIYIIVSAFSYFILIGGLKSLSGGGGYGVDLIGFNSFMYAEGSTLATVAICLIPLFVYLRSNSSLTQKKPHLKHYFTLLILCSLGILIGTQARTGLVALAVFAIIHFFESNQKFKYLSISAVFGVFFLLIASDAWFERMGTIKEANSTEVSALGRIVVWRWTIDYANERPLFGGGFMAYVANAGQLKNYQADGEVAIDIDKPKAFHNIFFEVLGETGYGGLTFFIGIIVHTITLLRSNKRALQAPIFLAGRRAIRTSLIIYCAGGMFLGLAFYPWIYYLYGCAVAIKNIEFTERPEAQDRIG